jgi:hypothetical protein
MKGTIIMKAYEILETDTTEVLGILLYYEKQKAFLIELNETLDEWTAPLLFSGYVKQNIYTILRETSRAWIMERIIPNSRQNIGDILSHHHLKEYDEIKMLELSDGKCSQDNLYIKKTESLPDYVLERMKRNLVDVLLLDNCNALTFFADNTVKKVDLKAFSQISDYLNNQAFIDTAQVGCGGYYLTFNDSIDIPSSLLYEKGLDIPLKRQDFISFLQKNILDTTGSCNLLNCTRQNLSYMVKQNQLPVAKANVNGNLYIKGDIMKNMW